MRETRYLTKQLLIEFNNASIREKRNNNIKEHVLESLPEGYYPLIFMMYHNNDEIRTKVILDDKGTCAYLDISLDRYETMPILDEHYNRDELLTEDEMRERMPYGGKEWVQKVYKKPYRDPAFRKEVLSAYNNQCAVCGVNNVNILRAAHIKDAAKGGSEDINNGICLCANHELAYDKGDLKIKLDGTIISLTNDKSIKNTHISFPLDKNKMPSKQLLQWKYENV